MHALHLLVVDDDPLLVRMLSDAFEARMPSWSTDSCSAPDDALELIAKTDYDVIVTDFQMPGIDGLELLERIRRHRPSTPTLLMTGHGGHDSAVRALRAGAFDFIEKPIDFEYLVAAIERGAHVRDMARRLDDQQAALERHAAELTQTVETKTKELREANRVKDEFLATLSHELRTPLTAILGWANLLAREELEPKMWRQAIEAIERNAAHQARLVDDLLDVSRIITGKLRLSRRPVDVAALVQAEVMEASTVAFSRNIRIEASIDREAGDVSGDPDRIQQIVANLLSNAIKFTPDGGLVHVELARAPASVRLVVTDSGVGIDPEFLPGIFDRFRQADRSLARSRGGLGLGLAIVRHLVELHGGSVWAESEGIGLGATFHLELPLVTASEHAADASRPIPLAPQHDPDLGGTHVLLVEDDEDTRRLIRVALERFGAKVTAVASAAHAAERLEAERPNVILCDIGLPKEDGYGFIRRVRSGDPATASTPTIALTAYARLEDVQNALRAGFDAHVAKPFEPAALAGRVRQLLGRSTEDGARRSVNRSERRPRRAPSQRPR